MSKNGGNTRELSESAFRSQRIPYSTGPNEWILQLLQATIPGDLIEVKLHFDFESQRRKEESISKTKAGPRTAAEDLASDKSYKSVIEIIAREFFRGDFRF